MVARAQTKGFKDNKLGRAALSGFVTYSFRWLPEICILN